jgi:hypothetical protein
MRNNVPLLIVFIFLVIFVVELVETLWIEIGFEIVLFLIGRVGL